MCIFNAYIELFHYISHVQPEFKNVKYSDTIIHRTQTNFNNISILSAAS